MRRSSLVAAEKIFNRCTFNAKTADSPDKTENRSLHTMTTAHFRPTLPAPHLLIATRDRPCLAQSSEADQSHSARLTCMKEKRLPRELESYYSLDEA